MDEWILSTEEQRVIRDALQYSINNAALNERDMEVANILLAEFGI
jgi:hypothetical protein